MHEVKHLDGRRDSSAESILSPTKGLGNAQVTAKPHRLGRTPGVSIAATGEFLLKT
jgi:hypothetical protein